MTNSALPSSIRDWLNEILSALPLKLCIDCWGTDQIWSKDNINNHFLLLTLRVNHPGVIRALFISRDPLILVEAYLHGYLDFVGNIDELILLEQKLPHLDIKRSKVIKAWAEILNLPRLPLLFKEDSVWKKLKARTHERDKAAVQYHYDLGNDFYYLWLDPLLVYSCAHFEHPQTNLKQAQEEKLDLICRKLRLTPGESLLDIGCGWGALLRWAITHYGVNGYGITLSKEQLAYNQQRIAEEGLGQKLKVELLDYRDLPKKPTFDKIVSVGMVEHVGIKNYSVYFQSVLSTLKPGGLFLNHGVTASVQWNGSSLGERFIYRYIFPDGELARLSTTLTAMEDAGWEIVDVDAWRPHYVETLRHWTANFDTAIEQAIVLFGERRVQLWRLYLIGSMLAFARNQMGVSQVLLRRKADEEWNLPLTRTGWLC